MTITHSRTNCRNSVSHFASHRNDVRATCRGRTTAHDVAAARFHVNTNDGPRVLSLSLRPVIASASNPLFFYRRRTSRTRTFLSLREKKHATFAHLFRPATFEFSSNFATANVPAKRMNDNGLQITCRVKKHENNTSVYFLNSVQ